MHREPLTVNTNGPEILLLNKREAATVAAMLRIVDNLIWYRYPDADYLYEYLTDLYVTCCSHHGQPRKTHDEKMTTTP